MAGAVVRGIAALAAVVALGACGSSSAPQTTSPPTGLSSALPTSSPPSSDAPAPSQTAAPTPAPTSAPPSSLTTGLVTTAHWTETSEGYRLRVRPSASGRRHAADHPATALSEALRSAGAHPLDLTPSIRQSLTNQLKCHAIFATRKPWWDLESWRPDVGFTATVLAACNP